MNFSTIGYCLKQGLKNITRNLRFSLASMATVSACIFLLCMFFCIVKNLDYVVKNAESNVGITVLFRETLSEEEIRRITELMLKQVADRLEEQEIRLTWDDSVTEKLAKDGYDPKFGARPLRRLIQRTVEDTLSEELLTGQVRLGQEIMLTVQDDRVVITGTETALPEETEPAGEEPGKEEEPVG